MPINSTTIIFGLAGTIIGACLSFLAQNYILRRNDFLSAAKEFRTAFSEEWAFLVKPIDKNMIIGKNIWTSKEIDKWITKHEIAIMKFWFYIGITKRNKFKKAYQEYCYPNISISYDFPRTDYYYEASNKPSVEAELEIRELLKKRINNLIKFAKI